MTAIITKYFGYTNHRSSRIKASSFPNFSVTINYDCALSPEANHHAAAKALATKLERKGAYVVNTLDANRNVYVRLSVGAALGDDALAFRI